MTEFGSRALLLGVLLFSVHACATPLPSQPLDGLTEVTLGGHLLKLVDAQGQCALLKQDGSTQKTDVAWPCRFSPNRAGESRVEMFQSVPIVLVEHCHPSSEVAAAQRQSQAVRLRDGRYETSAVNTSRCGTGVQDQKMFTGLFRW
jgi:hypothetical protein